MGSLRLAFTVAFLLLGCVPLQVSAQPAGIQYELVIECGAAIPLATPSTPVTTSGGGCPIRAIDGGDLMGDPSLAVDPLRPEDLILASLHGQSAGTSGPSLKARSGQVFTTFTSQDQGQSWIDNPFVPPDDIGFAYGMHPQVTIDPYGQVYVGSLYAIPDGQSTDGNVTYNTFEYVIAAQKFEGIDTVDDEQDTSNGGYNAEYLTPVYEGNQIDQMWFLFNPITDNMTLVWRETVPKPPIPPCDTDGSYLLDAGGIYVKADPTSTSAGMYQESNGIPDLQTENSCPSNPDSRFVAAPAVAAPAPSAPTAMQASAPRASQPARFVAGLPVAVPAPLATTATAMPTAVPTTTPAALPPSSVAPRSAPERAVAAQQDDGNASDQVGAIGVVWTTADQDTPYYYQDMDNVIQPCSTSTNPVLSFGWLYIGCVVDTSQGEFRWAPGVRNGTVQLFRLDPDGGAPEYMGQAPDMVGLPKLGVRSDGRLALVAAGSSPEGALLLSAAFGRYEPAESHIDWTKHVSVGHDVLPLDPSVLVTRADIQDMMYREQSGALHVILKTTVNIVGGVRDVDDKLGIAPHIEKRIVAIDEEYGVLDVLDASDQPKLAIGDWSVRSQDTTIATAPELAFQDLSDDFLQLPPEPYSWRGIDLGPSYQREFFAIGDYGTVLFAEVIENTTIRGFANAPPPAPPPATPSPATTNLVAPVAGVSILGATTGLLVAHRRKNPLAAITKDE